MHFVQANGILSAKNGMNLYRGCQHGCIYCDSRSVCYGIENFEDIEVKENAIELLDAALRHKRKKCMIGTGAMTDPYIPLESELQFTRKALEVIDRHGFGVTVQTKSSRVLCDLDLLTSINSHSKAVVQMTLTTYDDNLCRIIEPNVSPTSERFHALETLRDAGIPTVVWLDPILPFINDTRENVSGILDMCIKAKVYGVICFGMGLTLREGNREYFYNQLDKHFPKLKEKYITTYGNRYEINSPNSDMLWELFYSKCEQNGILHDNSAIFRYLSTYEEKGNEQLSLF